jgi:catechol 2,3-dioxygenase-like lactoylglutathione lyase family enzyme
MDNVGIVVDDLDAAVAFFTELGLELEGEAQIGVLSVLSPLPRAAAVGTRALRRRARSPAPAEPLVASALMR